MIAPRQGSAQPHAHAAGSAFAGALPPPVPVPVPVPVPAPASGVVTGWAPPSFASGEPGAEGAAAVPAAVAPQSEDKDYPELQADKEKKAADAALAREARKAQLDREKEKGTPIYDKWEFWAITGAVVVGAVLTIWGGSAILHQMNGGDIQACPMTATDRCFGQGR